MQAPPHAASRSGSAPPGPPARNAACSAVQAPFRPCALRPRAPLRRRHVARPRRSLRAHQAARRRRPGRVRRGSARALGLVRAPPGPHSRPARLGGAVSLLSARLRRGGRATRCGQFRVDWLWRRLRAHAGRAATPGARRMFQEVRPAVLAGEHGCGGAAGGPRRRRLAALWAEPSAPVQGCLQGGLAANESDDRRVSSVRMGRRTRRRRGWSGTSPTNESSLCRAERAGAGMPQVHIKKQVFTPRRDAPSRRRRVGAGGGRRRQRRASKRAAGAPPGRCAA